MNEFLYGDLSVIGMQGSQNFVSQVDAYLRNWRQSGDESFLITPEWPRFGTGEGKCLLHDSMRGRDVYVYADLFNYGVRYKMYGMECPMSPDDHFQDLKRLIGALAGKQRRVSVIMPMLYEGRQHRRTARESLDCAMALQELVSIGVSNIITFDAHDPRVQNAIPNSGFDNVQPTYQFIKSLVRNVPDIHVNPDELMVLSPDEGGMGRAMYFASILGLQLGTFYKRRDYSVVKDGKNPIVAHEYLGKSVSGKAATSVLSVIGDVKPDAITLDREKNRLSFVGKASVCVLLENGEDHVLSDVALTFPIRLELPLSATVPQGETLDCTCCLIGQSGRLDSNNLYVDLEVALDIGIFATETVTMVERIRLDTEHPFTEPCPTMRLYYPRADQRLWEIAKHFHTAPEEILRANHLDASAVASAPVLLIPTHA